MADVCFVALVRSLSLSPYSLPILFFKIGRLRLYLKKPLFLLRRVFSNKTFASLRSSVRCRSSLLAANFVFQNWTASSLFEKTFIPPSEGFFKQDVCFVALVRSLSLLLTRCQFCFSKLDSASASRADGDETDDIANFQACPHAVVQIDIIAVQQDQTPPGFRCRLFPMGGFYFYQHLFNICRLKTLLRCAG